MTSLTHLFQYNRRWAARIREARPTYFPALAARHHPDYLWIGCSDSRVPPEEILGVPPGKLLVHRNIANLVHPTDRNALSVIHYAVDTLKVRHVIVCGHSACGGIRAAMDDSPRGFAEPWLKPLRDLYQRHRSSLDAIGDEAERMRALCEMNVLHQVVNVGDTAAVQDAWRRGQPVAVHGWVYDLADGLLRDLKIDVASRKELAILRRRTRLDGDCLSRPVAFRPARSDT